LGTGTGLAVRARWCWRAFQTARAAVERGVRVVVVVASGVAASVVKVADAVIPDDAGVATVADAPVTEVMRDVAEHAAGAGTEPASGAEELGLNSCMPIGAQPGLPPTSWSTTNAAPRCIGRGTGRGGTKSSSI
jgi:hypothetical protein